jgi:hypothetical protein
MHCLRNLIRPVYTEATGDKYSKTGWRLLWFYRASIRAVSGGAYFGGICRRSGLDVTAMHQM